MNVTMAFRDLSLPAPDTTRGADADGEAIARTLSGDLRAFEHVVARHERAVYTLLHRMTGSAEDAEDLAQETFLKAYRALAQFDRKRPFRPWILRIAANAAHQHARRHRRVLVVSLDDEFGEPIDIADDRAAVPGDDLARMQDANLLARAVAELRGESAALFHLHYREELAVETIAETLGKRPNTVAVALHRLRQQLRHAVERLITMEERR